MQLLQNLIVKQYNKMEQQIQNLKQSELTQVLADGFAQLYHKRPQFPVSYLAEYLKHHSKKKYLKQSLLVDRLAYNKKICDQMQQQQKSAEAFKKQQEKRLQESEAEIEKYLKKIKDTQYHSDILNEFCTWIQDNFMLTGAYMGELKHKKKKINLQEQDSEEAHFDAQAEKLIYFQSTSRSHQQLLKDKTLPLNSVLGKLLSGQIASNESEEQPAQDGQENKGEPKPRDQIYFPSVVDNKQLTFFRFPRLGAFFGLGIKIKSYSSENLFDANVLKVQSYQKASEQYEKQREERQNKFREGYDEKANSGAEEQELEAMQKQFQEEQKQFPRPSFPQLDCVERQVVFGFDTLGQDREISKEDQQKIRKYVEYLKQQWQEKQLEAVKLDIDQHMKLSDKLQNPAQQIFTKLIEDQDKELPANQQAQKVKENQKLLELQVDTLRIEKIKQYISEQRYLPFIEQILTAKTLRYKEILKYWLMFCEYKKQNIVIPETNILDLRKAKKFISKNMFIDKITQYNPRGAKPTLNLQGYAKWERISKNLEKIDINAVVSYNIYLAFILRFLILVAKVRQADRNRRIEVMQEERKARKQRIRQNRQKNKIEQEKLNAAKAEAQQKQNNKEEGQEREEFNEEAWRAQYMENEENHLNQIGPMIPDQIDKDLQNGQEIFPESESEKQEEKVQEKQEGEAEQNAADKE